MSADDFIKAVDNLVREWRTDEPKAGAVPRAELLDIWQKIREEAVYELAQAEQQRDKALEKLHKRYVRGPSHE